MQLLGRFRTLTPHLATRNYLHEGEIARTSLAQNTVDNAAAMTRSALCRALFTNLVAAAKRRVKSVEETPPAGSWLTPPG